MTVDTNKCCGDQVPIFINKQKYEAELGPQTGEYVKALAGYGADYDLLLVPGETQLGTPIGHDETIEIRPGLHFHALAGNRNFGQQGLHAGLETGIAALRSMGHDVEVRRDGAFAGVILRDFPLPSAFSKRATRLLLRVPLDPNGAMDMFHVESDVTLVGGAHPQAAAVFETHFGEQWRRFSWHRNAPWMPGRDNIVTHLAFVEERLARGV